ncbi:hypothetical protein HQ590_15505 [bacterium]|nr:hypothetical protein [bacterium]
MKTYRETFDHGPGGWYGWDGNEKGYRPLAVQDGVAVTRSPWWIDYNHAPPGAGYLHMLFSLNTKGPFGEHLQEVGGPNGFVASGCPRDLTNARLTARLKGELTENGARVTLLVQAAGGDLISGWLLTGQPFRVTPEWSDQTVTLVPDESQWRCLGARHDRTDFYGRLPLATVLQDVNVNIMFVLFPLTIAPMGPLAGDPHQLRPERDYPVWRSRLPEGYIELDTVNIELP